MVESQFQKKLIKEIQNTFPDSVILKNDPNYIQGVPDLTILYKDKWACLEVKKSIKASHRPNQDYYVSKLDDMSFSRFVCPENYKEVLDELQQTFRT